MIGVFLITISPMLIYNYSTYGTILDNNPDFYLYANSEFHNTESKELLKQNGYTYEKDEALWLKTTSFGDDKDRVMRKSDGSFTYFVPDVAYHLDKWERGFHRVINEQGADHHSTINRVRAGLQGLKKDIPPHWPEYVLHQMITVTKHGAEIKISKRAGSYMASLKPLNSERISKKYMLLKVIWIPLRCMNIA